MTLNFLQSWFKQLLNQKISIHYKKSTRSDQFTPFGITTWWLMIFLSCTNQFRSILIQPFCIISVKLKWADLPKENGKYWGTWLNWTTFQSLITNQWRDSTIIWELPLQIGTWLLFKKNSKTLNLCSMPKEEEINSLRLISMVDLWNISISHNKSVLSNIPFLSIIWNLLNSAMLHSKLALMSSVRMHSYLAQTA